jgi:hypothetical protein
MCIVALDAFTRSSLNAFPVGFIALYVLGLAVNVACREARSAPQISTEELGVDALAQGGRLESTAV